MEEQLSLEFQVYFIQAPKQFSRLPLVFEELYSPVNKTHPRYAAATHSSAIARAGKSERVRKQHVFSTCASVAAAGENAAINSEECRAASSQ